MAGAHPGQTLDVGRPGGKLTGQMTHGQRGDSSIDKEAGGSLSRQWEHRRPRQDSAGKAAVAQGGEWTCVHTGAGAARPKARAVLLQRFPLEAKGWCQLRTPPAPLCARVLAPTITLGIWAPAPPHPGASRGPFAQASFPMLPWSSMGSPGPCQVARMPTVQAQDHCVALGRWAVLTQEPHFPGSPHPSSWHLSTEPILPGVGDAGPSCRESHSPSDSIGIQTRVPFAFPVLC